MALWLFCVVGVAALGCSVPFIVRASRERRLVRNPRQAPQAAASLWYARMSRSLERYGYRKAAAQTPTEFVGIINDPELRAKVAEFTSCYERARFGCSMDDAGALPKLFEQIQGKA